MPFFIRKQTLAAMLQQALDKQTAQLGAFIINQLNPLKGNLNKLMADEQLELDALAKIDAATNQIATTLQTALPVVQSISTEVDALVAAQKAAGVPQDIIDRTVAIGNSAQATADAFSGVIPVLQGIASKGAAQPVPVPVPAPTPAPDNPPAEAPAGS